MENADPSAMADLELYMNQLVPEDYSGFTHTYEGADDMPSHIKMVLTTASENIPFSKGSLELVHGRFSCGSTEHFHITENLFLHTWDNEKIIFSLFCKFYVVESFSRLFTNW